MKSLWPDEESAQKAWDAAYDQPMKGARNQALLRDSNTPITNEKKKPDSFSPLDTSNSSGRLKRKYSFFANDTEPLEFRDGSNTRCFSEHRQKTVSNNNSPGP